MPKLPDNLVKPPAFDNPLRRTVPAQASIPEAPASPVNDTAEPAPGGVVIPIAAAPRIDSQQDPALMPHRITVRIDDATRCALEAECYKRRVAGEKTNLAEIARGILKQWAKRAE
jgi:hypothetical protein